MYKTFNGDIVTNDFRTAQVFKNYGIDFCCGGNVKLESIAKEKNIDLDEIEGKLKNPEGYPTLDVHAAMVRPEDVPMVEAMFEKTPNINAFLLADHGVVAMGKDPLAAEHTAELVEETAQVAILDKVVEKLGL